MASGGDGGESSVRRSTTMTSDGNESNGEDQAVSRAEAALKARLGRRRTKTGCLTCRKRRIKCGEERPICRNCVKSRRHCEGYTQRVLFRPQHLDYSTTDSSAHTTFQTAPEPGQHHGLALPYTHDNTFYPLQPRPLVPPLPGPYSSPDHRFIMQPTFLNEHPSLQHIQQRSTPQATSHSTTANDHTPVAASGIAFTFHGPTTLPHHDSVLINQPTIPPSRSHGSTPSNTNLGDSSFRRHAQHASNSSWSSDSHTPLREFSSYDHLPMHCPPPAASPRSDTRSAASSVAEDFLYFSRQQNTAQLLDDAAVEVQDDDYYDFDPEEVSTPQTDLAHLATEMQARLRLVSNMSDLNAPQDVQLSTYSHVLHNGTLDTYRVERVASPLRNPATARVFIHFMTVTGPSLSPCERSTGLLFACGPVPLSQRGLWTYSMPQLALQNQGLLHAMLALSSLHISRLQGSSATPSMQHYAWSLKRIHSAVTDRKKRLNLATIAASMLLGFYEVISADHTKWNTHLAGARQLLLEIDFATMVRQYREMKVERQVRLHQQAQPGASTIPPTAEDLMLDDLLDVDEAMASQLFGKEVRYGHQEFSDGTALPPRLDVCQLEILKDLFWWYCKQDAYQSLIGGNPLLMDFDLWAACPPRAPMNIPDRVYGTYDHLILLLGRVAAFLAKDRKRKLDEMRRNGGQWTPHPASHIAQSNTPKKPLPRPEFYGMAPAPPPTAMPASYRSLDGDKVPMVEENEWTIEAALEEYEQIREALQLFKSNLGPAFQPSREGELTPFGTALIYAWHDIGCLWTIYNAIVIVAIRSHPFYHPAAHVAAAMANAETLWYANEVGRIAAGIMPGPPDMPLDPTLASSLIESCLPSFFAGIQYVDAEQRHATVTRIHAIARKTAWGTGDVIANGLETAWVKAAQAGRGPPYERVLRAGVVTSTDSRLNGSYEHQDPLERPSEDDHVDRRFVRQKAVARLHWAIGIMGTEQDIP